MQISFPPELNHSSVAGGDREKGRRGSWRAEKTEPYLVLDPAVRSHKGEKKKKKKKRKRKTSLRSFHNFFFLKMCHVGRKSDYGIALLL
jgi:hypothetical protein